MRVSFTEWVRQLDHALPQLGLSRQSFPHAPYAFMHSSGMTVAAGARYIASLSSEGAE